MNTDFIRKTRQEISCKIMRTMLNFALDRSGEACKDGLLRAIGLDEAFLRNENNWVSFETYNTGCEFLKSFFHDEKIMYQVGLYSFSKIENFGSIAKLGLLLLSPESIYRRTPSLANASVRFGEYRPLDISANRMVLEFRLKSGYPFYQHNCDYRMGVFAGIPQIYGLPVAKLRDVECIGRGDGRCVYELAWQTPSSGWRGRIVTRSLIFGSLGAIVFLGWAGSTVERLLFTAGTLALVTAAGYIVDLRKTIKRQEALNEERANEIENALVFANQKYHEASETLAKLEAMIEATTAFNLRLLNKELYELVLDILKKSLRYDRAMIAFHDSKENRLRDPMIIGEPSTEVRHLMLSCHDDLSNPESLQARVMSERKPILVGDVQTHPGLLHREKIAQSGSCSFAVVPLKIGTRVIGTLTVDRLSSQNSLTPDDLRILQTLSDMLSVVLENSELYQDMEKRIRQRTWELVTAKRQLEEAYEDLKLTQSQLLHSEKMASIGKLVAGIAHELNNPAGIISGYLELTLMHARKIHDLLSADVAGAKVVDELDELIACIEPSKRAMNRIRSIVEDLRNFARLDETELMPANLNEGLQKMLRFFRNKTENRITIVTEFAELPMINCYPGDLNQAFSNIFENAVESIKLNGVIRISTSLRPSDDKLNKPHIAVSFVDNGHGIPNAILDRVFDPFFTTKAVGEGQGLGLSIAYGIIQRHAGNIEITSDDKGGTSVVVRLPVREDY